MASRPERFVGIDVHKDTLEVHLEGQDERWEYSNDTAGIGDLVTTFGPLSPTLVVVEASGGYERAVVSQGYAAGLPMVVVNPTRVRRLAEAMGIIAKTDAIDAQVIARFASVVHPPARSPTCPRWERPAAAPECVGDPSAPAGRDAHRGEESIEHLPSAGTRRRGAARGMVRCRDRGTRGRDPRHAGP